MVASAVEWSFGKWGQDEGIEQGRRCRAVCTYAPTPLVCLGGALGGAGDTRVQQ